MVTGQRQGGPHGDGAVRSRDLRLGDDRDGEAPVEVRRDEHWNIK